MTTPLKILLITLCLIIGLYLLACALLAYNARGMLYHPVPRDPAVPYWTLHRADADILISSKKQPRPQRVLYFGGNAEDVSQALPMLEQAFPGATIHAMHYRGYGGSSGSPTEARLIADALALYDASGSAATDTTVIGRSLGSGVAVQLAAARAVQRLVLITPYDSIGDLAAGMFPLFPVRLLLRDHYDSRRYVAGIKAPTTLIIAGRDEVIPNASSLRLLQRFPSGVAQAVTIADADHNDVSAYPQFAQALRGR
ncbi:alpha/beta hydrolase [Stenotrophomonas sp.]|uniref:alpha/beta hydrolase n=1 Tax=Stenotrophomonas sp. TaxID=69392 RepID=UPI0028ACD3FC|nr:alpha/beta hydrolase [Stenotrophomonas sp.]